VSAGNGGVRRVVNGSPPLRAIVCGSRFGRTYMAALQRPGSGFELAGILARGSDRSHRCAEHYRVPLYTDLAELPGDVDLACVVVGGELNGGRGAELAQALLERGVHVVQEHPVTERELTACLRAAHRSRRVYRLNTHYTDVAPVRVLLAAARALFAAQPPRFADATCSIIVLGPVLEIIAGAFGRPRPWRFEAPQHAGPYTSLVGEIAGVPLTLRVQNELHPGNRDSFAHILGRLTLGAEGGSLLLGEMHGPVLWCPRAHMPPEVDSAVTLAGVEDPALDLPAGRVLFGACAPSVRQVVEELWPAATARVLGEVRSAILTGAQDPARGQLQLALCRLTADVASALGRPYLLDDPAPATAEADAIVTSATQAAADQRMEPAHAR
jgi:pyochelin biosynthesis protein PchG